MRLQKQEKKKEKKYFWGIENLSCNCILESNSSTNSLHDYCDTLFPLVSFLNTFKCFNLYGNCSLYIFLLLRKDSCGILLGTCNIWLSPIGTSKLSRFKLSRFMQLLPVLILLSSCWCQLKITEKPLSSIFFAYECNIKRSSTWTFSKVYASSYELPMW